MRAGSIGFASDRSLGRYGFDVPCRKPNGSNFVIGLRYPRYSVNGTLKKLAKRDINCCRGRCWSERLTGMHGCTAKSKPTTRAAPIGGLAEAARGGDRCPGRSRTERHKAVARGREEHNQGQVGSYVRRTDLVKWYQANS